MSESTEEAYRHHESMQDEHGHDHGDHNRIAEFQGGGKQSFLLWEVFRTRDAGKWCEQKVNEVSYQYISIYSCPSNKA